MYLLILKTVSVMTVYTQSIINHQLSDVKDPFKVVSLRVRRPSELIDQQGSHQAKSSIPCRAKLRLPLKG